MQDPPRDNLVRSAPFYLERKSSDDGLTLTGHGAVFNEWTEIDSWEGRFRERIAPGAFRKTLDESITPDGNRVRLQFDHGTHPLIGSLPIGAIRRLKEDDRGLYVEARLADNWLVQPVRDAIENGSIDGMSFRFTVEREEWQKLDTELPERTITEVRLLEVGPVVWPAYDTTDVGVRSLELARSLSEADEETRREVGRLIITDLDALTDAAERTSDESVAQDTEPPGEAAAGTSDVGHSEYEPARRPVLTDEKKRQDREAVKKRVAAALSKEL